MYIFWNKGWNNKFVDRSSPERLKFLLQISPIYIYLKDLSYLCIDTLSIIIDILSTSCIDNR